MTENQSMAVRFGPFWERMARTYPLPFDDAPLADTRQVILGVRARGVRLSNASILDIGCGTGIYTLPLALEADRVTGLDDSAAMLGRMEGVMAAEGICNVDPVKASWKDLDVRRHGFEKAFDVVWASMTPAVQTAEDFRRMERCAKTWCVFIGWGRKRKSAVTEEVFRLHGLEFGPPPGGAGAACDILTGFGRTPWLDYFETSWTWEGPLEDAVEDMACFVEMQGKEADRRLIRRVLSPYERDGEIRYLSEVEEGVLVWPAD